MGRGTVVAVDPDVEKSAVAVLDVEGRSVSAVSLSFPELLSRLGALSRVPDSPLTVVVEAAWATRHNWHLSRFETPLRAAAKGYDVGRNHETGHKIVEMCESMGIRVVEQPPLRKLWRGRDGKITQDEIARFIPSFPKRSNQDMRDAALLAWCFAGLPIRL